MGRIVSLAGMKPKSMNKMALYAETIGFSIATFMQLVVWICVTSLILLQEPGYNIHFSKFFISEITDAQQLLLDSNCCLYPLREGS